MLTPSYLLNATEPAEEIAEKLHSDILMRIIKRIRIRFERGDDYILTAVDKWQIETLQQAGFLLNDIQKEIAAATGYMQTEIAEAMEDAGVKALAYDDAIYREAGLDPVPLVQSPYLIQLMQDTYEQTAGEWRNFTSISKRAVHELFVEACDTAYMQAISGAISPAQAYLEALEKIVDGGVYVQYPGGRRDTIETATARAVRTGISQASGRIQIARMDEMHVDLVLVSSHLGARPEHYVWQGKVYSRHSGGDYPDFVESTGYGTVTGLCGANCRHNFSPYFEGMKNPFQEYDSEENQKQYELEQRQRTLERRIRDTKRQTMGWKTALDGENDPVRKAALEEKYQQKAALLQKQNKAYNDFCESTGQKKRSDRIAIAKWDRKQAAQARAAAKKWNNRPNPFGNPVAFTRNDGIMKSMDVGRSLGAASKKYAVKMPGSRDHVRLAEGQTVSGKTFAGKGTDTEIRERYRLEVAYKKPADSFEKVSGNGHIIVDGKKRYAELHWYESENEVFEMKVKRFLDES